MKRDQEGSRRPLRPTAAAFLREETRERRQSLGVRRMDVDRSVKGVPGRAGFHMCEDDVDELCRLVPDERCAEDLVGFVVDDETKEADGLTPLDRARDVRDGHRDGASVETAALRIVERR